MAYALTNDDHAYEYRSGQLDLTEYWDMSSSEADPHSDAATYLPQAVLDYMRGQSRICEPQFAVP